MIFPVIEHSNYYIAEIDLNISCPVYTYPIIKQSECVCVIQMGVSTQNMVQLYEDALETTNFGFNANLESLVKNFVSIIALAYTHHQIKSKSEDI